MRKKIPVCLVKEKEGGYSIFIPGIDGVCCDQGETKEEALLNMRELLKTYLEEVSREGKAELLNVSVENIEIEI